MDLIFASNNKNKVREMQNIIPPRYNILSLMDIGSTEEIKETGRTLEANAKIKAQYVYERYGKCCFADDTGLVVTALNGEPGVLSARYAGTHRSPEDNMKLVLEKLGDNPNREARFITVVCLILRGKPYVFNGEVKGNITMEKRGYEGFGYDPIFMPSGYNLTFAQMPLEEKNRISHRRIAFGKMVSFLSKYNDGGDIPVSY